MKQLLLTPVMGKRLIGKAMVIHPAVAATIKSGRLVIVAGTTNGYVAEEILTATGQGDRFDRAGFCRGLVTAPGRAGSGGEFAGDVVLVDGVWDRGKQIFDVADDLAAGDVILKGANAVNLCRRQAGVYIGHPASGTIGAAIPTAVGKRVRLILPVGLEKRVTRDINDIAAQLNAPTSTGPRMMPVPGEIVTELDAIELLTGATASLVAAGGVCGAEGGVFLAVEGSETQVEATTKLVDALADEPPCQA